MDDLAHGTRDKRGDWTPKNPADIAPIWAFPPKPLTVLKWLPSYFLPYDVIFFASAFAWWYWVMPDMDTVRAFDLASWGTWRWIIRLFVVNTVALFAFFGVFQLRLYTFRKQGTRFKYNGQFPADKQSDVFWFKRQDVDSALRILFHAMPIWTAIEVVILLAYAKGYATWWTLADHPVYLVILTLLIPIIHETHFYLIHRLIHVPVLYKYIHSVHHNSVNPSPYSSLSMHPAELLLYLGMAFWQILIPSNPILAIYALHRAGFGAIPGHVGFDKIEVGSEGGVDTHAYIHYLHHKHFEVNYGDGLIPFDKWFGTFHDGSKHGQELMDARYAKKVAKLNKSAAE